MRRTRVRGCDRLVTPALDISLSPTRGGRLCPGRPGATSDLWLRSLTIENFRRAGRSNVIASTTRFTLRDDVLAASCWRLLEFAPRGSDAARVTSRRPQSHSLTSGGPNIMARYARVTDKCCASADVDGAKSRIGAPPGLRVQDSTSTSAGRDAARFSGCRGCGLVGFCGLLRRRLRFRGSSSTSSRRAVFSVTHRGTVADVLAFAYPPPGRPPPPPPRRRSDRVSIGVFAGGHALPRLRADCRWRVRYRTLASHPRPQWSYWRSYRRLA